MSVRVIATDHTEPTQPLDSMHVTRAIAYCRTCGRQISAETAAANGGNCNAHAHDAVGVRWLASDDYRP